MLARMLCDQARATGVHVKHCWASVIDKAHLDWLLLRAGRPHLRWSQTRSHAGHILRQPAGLRPSTRGPQSLFKSLKGRQIGQSLPTRNWDQCAASKVRLCKGYSKNCPNSQYNGYARQKVQHFCRSGRPLQYTSMVIDSKLMAALGWSLDHENSKMWKYPNAGRAHAKVQQHLVVQHATS